MTGPRYYSQLEPASPATTDLLPQGTGNETLSFAWPHSWLLALHSLASVLTSHLSFTQSPPLNLSFPPPFLPAPGPGSQAGCLSASSRPALSIQLSTRLLHHFLFPSSPLSLPPWLPSPAAGGRPAPPRALAAASCLAARSDSGAGGSGGRPAPSKAPGGPGTWRTRASGGERSGGPVSAVSPQLRASHSPQAAKLGEAQAGRGVLRRVGGRRGMGSSDLLWELEAERLDCVCSLNISKWGFWAWGHFSVGRPYLPQRSRSPLLRTHLPQMRLKGPGQNEGSLPYG